MGMAEPLAGPEEDGLLVDGTFGRRIRTLARSGPLHQLVRNAAYQDGDWSCYDLLALELAAIDYVMIRMGLATGTTREALTAALADLAAAAAPDRDAAEHRRVAAAVIDWLLNDNGPRLIAYTDFSAGSARHTTRMAYLVERYGVGPLGDGTPMLRVPDEAINLLLGAIDLDLEDERAALELVLNRAIDRGHFDEAVRVGRRALGLTIRYMERIREELERALIDIRGVDLDGAVGELLGSALAHLDERLEEDSGLRERVLDVLDEATDEKVVRASRQLLDLIELSARRNRELQSFLQRAPTVLLAEQRRQVLAPVRTVETVDLSGELLRPLLAGTLTQAWAPAAAFFASAVGSARLPRFSVAGLIDLLLTPTAEQTQALPDEESPPLVYGEPVERFPAQVWRAAASALGRVGDGRLLSSLLRDARVAARGTGACERDAAVLTALCVLGRFAPDHLASGVTGDPTTGPQGRGGGAGGWQIGDATSRVTADTPGGPDGGNGWRLPDAASPEADAGSAAEQARRQVHAALGRLAAVKTGAELTGDPDVAGTELLVRLAVAAGAAAEEGQRQTLEEKMV